MITEIANVPKSLDLSPRRDIKNSAILEEFNEIADSRVLLARIDTVIFDDLAQVLFQNNPCNRPGSPEESSACEFPCGI